MIAVVLCAGGSARMGSPKGLLELHGKPLLAWHCEALARVGDVVVVLGADADAHRAVVPGGVEVVENAAWRTSAMIDSLKLALDAMDDDEPALVTPVDVPPARVETLRLLAKDGPAAVPVDGRGRRGHPVRIGESEIARIRKQPPPGGLRTLLLAARLVPVGDPLVALDFDDPVAWRAFAERWEPG